MKRLWQRLLRLLRQSEIRLGAGRLQLAAVRPGDRLQIGPRLWRVERMSPAGACLELTAEEGGARAWLRAPENDPELPLIFEDAETSIRLPPGGLLHFESCPRKRKPSAS